MNKIFVEAKKLINSNGEVWLWKSETMDGVRHFSTNEDAQKYIELLHQFSRENGRPEEAYGTGTAADFMAEAQKFERRKKANELKEYCKHVDKLIECRRREIKALDGLAEVCWKFDGKVLNKRFHAAVNKATGFNSSFSEHWYDLVILNFYGEYRPSSSIPTDWSHGYNSITGKKKDIDPTCWQWNTGDRLETEKAIAVIAYWKNDRLQTIQELEGTKKQYATYLKLARKAEKIFREMDGYGYTIREYAKYHALNPHNNLANFFRTW